MGPTPPGTGVIYPALSQAGSKSTSPERSATVFPVFSLIFSPIRLTPTSITHAPFLIHSGLTSPGTPAATIRISARRTMFRQVFRAGVNNRNRSVGARPFLHHHIRYRFAYNIRAPNDHDLYALCLYARSDNHFLYGGRCTRRVFDFFSAYHQSAYINRVKTVNILVRVYRVNNLLFIYMPWQRQLNKYP